MNLESICKYSSVERIRRHFTIRSRDGFGNYEFDLPPHLMIVPRISGTWNAVILCGADEVTIAKYTDPNLAYAVRDDFDNAARIFLENELSCMSVIYEVPSESMARTLLFKNTNKTEEWRNES